ncbi:MAG: fasciclin domain-containing protein [Rubricoccaceae bacterium]
MRLPPLLRPVAAGTLLLGLALALGSCDALVRAEPPLAAPRTLAEALAAPSFAKTRALAEQTGLTAQLTGNTFFAPDDEAYALLGLETEAALRERPETLARVLRRHVVTGRLTRADLTDGALLPTLEGTPLRVSVQGPDVFVGQARVKAFDLATDGGVLHRVETIERDHLTSAERLELAPALSRARAALERTGLAARAAGEAPYTLLLPVDEGWAGLPGGPGPLFAPHNADLLLATARAFVLPGRHTLAELQAAGVARAEGGLALPVATRGPRVYVGDMRVALPDVATRNGVLHVVAQPAQQHLTLGQRLRLVPDAADLRSAFASAGLLGELEAPGERTLFAPTNAAFTALGTAVTTPLFGGQEPELRRHLLRYALVQGRVPAAAVVNGAVFTSVTGEPVAVTPAPDSGRPRIARARLGATLDLEAANGTLHLTQDFLNPPLSLYDQLLLSGYVRFRDLVRVGGLADALRGPGPLTVLAAEIVPAGYLTGAGTCQAPAAARAHVAEGRHPFVNSGFALPMLDGRTVSLSLSGGATRIGAGSPPPTYTSAVRATDLTAANGIIHGLARALVPASPDACLR